eukprot:s4170_g3.t1
MACFAIGRRWIQGAVIYGHAAHPDQVSTKQATDMICQQATERLCESSSGLRFIAGDFNQEHGELESMRYWTDQGWINAQVWAEQKLGIPIRPTCKKTTTKDHLYLSPELAMYLQDVVVSDSYFKDHAVLAVKLSSLGAPPLMPLWRMPRPIKWDEVPTMPDKEFPPLDTSCPSQAYANMLVTFETEVSQVLLTTHKPTLLQAQKGRGQTREVTMRAEFSAPPKKGRPGDLAPEYHGVDVRHAKWLRQARRLVNYAHLSNQPNLVLSQVTHKEKLWKSIQTAKGFSPSFLAWWNENCSEVAALGEAEPSPTMANLVAQTFETKLRQFEKLLARSRVADAKQRRHQDPNVIFKDLQSEAQLPCQTLLQRNQANVVAVDEDEMALEIHPPQEWDRQSTLATAAGPVQIVHAEPDKLWVDRVDATMLEKPVSQETLVGEITDMFEAFRLEWVKRWDKHFTVQDEFWQPIVDFVQMAFPNPPQMPTEPITYDMWRNALKKKSKRAATGPDGLTRNDLLRMPRGLTEQLLELLMAVEREGAAWPEQLVQAFVIALAKSVDAECVNDYRPVSIFPVAYRVWHPVYDGLRRGMCIKRVGNAGS